MKRALAGAMLLALTTVGSFAADRSVTIVANDTWKPIAYEKDIVPGSVLDFSASLDAPAGKHGFVTVRQGKFVFADRPDRPVRFYGVNLVNTANYFDKTWCQRLAARLARMGYNAVRLHHFDDKIVKKTDRSSVELDPARVDQLDYLFHCLKKQGIYVTTDLYTCRKLVKGEIPELPDQAVEGDTFKGLVFVFDSAFENWAAFSENLLTHVNPYTGLAWKDDPALVGLSLVNEDTIFGLWCQKELTDLYNMQRFGTWAQQRGITRMTRDERQMFRIQFLVETHQKGYAKMRTFLATLGVKAPITDQNKWSLIPLCLSRSEYDYVDNHFYWDHPAFLGSPWRLPVRPMDHNRSVLDEAASAPGKIFPTRLFGKPMTVTEFDYAYPNRFRAEGGAVAGAYAALQDWDGLYRFAYAHSDATVKEQKPSVFFDVAADPIKVLSERIAMLLFLRGDVARAAQAYPVLVSSHCVENLATLGEFSKDIWQLGLVGRLGTVRAETAPTGLPEGTVAITGVEPALAEKDWGHPFVLSSKAKGAIQALIESNAVDRRLVDLDQGHFTSATGEIALDAKRQTFRVVTPRSEVLIAPEGTRIEGKVMTVANKTSRAVFFAAACDGQPLAASRRILILHLTDSHCAGEQFDGPEMTVWEKTGTLPYLIKDGQARIMLQGDFSGHRLYGIDLTGKRGVELPTEKVPGGLAWDLNIFSQAGTTMAYELVKE